MADNSMPEPGKAASAGNPQIAATDTLVAAGAELVFTMGTFFEMARHEIAEGNSTDFDGLDLLVKGASAEVSRFDRVLNQFQAGKEAPSLTDKATAERGENLGVRADLEETLVEIYCVFESICEVTDDNLAHGAPFGVLGFAAKRGMDLTDRAEAIVKEAQS